MKKAFDANVSRAKPRLRMSFTNVATEPVADAGVSVAAVEALAQSVLADPTPVIPDLHLGAEGEDDGAHGSEEHGCRSAAGSHRSGC
ncbi:MAG: hypothetical protein QM817_39570 [Archangium sp.]